MSVVAAGNTVLNPEWRTQPGAPPMRERGGDT